MDADDILEQLKDVGALGGAAKTPRPPATTVLGVDIEQGAPSAEVRDLRGEQTVEAIDALLHHVDGMRAALVKLREVWVPAEGEQIDPLAALETPETAAAPSEAPEVPSEPQSPQEPAQSPAEAEHPDYQRAREAALRKIRGEDVPGGAHDDEEDVPFVGQTRALPMGEEPEEVTIGTVGTIKPSFPVEG